MMQLSYSQILAELWDPFEPAYNMVFLYLYNVGNIGSVDLKTLEPR